MYRYTVVEKVYIRRLRRKEECIIPIRRFFPKRNTLLGVSAFTWKANVRTQAAKRAAAKKEDRK